MSAFTRQKIAQYLAKYAADPSVGIVVSSDFCHWGERFRYTRYQASHDAAPQVLTSRSPSSAYAACPIHKSIEALDIDAMARISFDKGGVWHAHDRFKSYIMTTRNTICGQHPILLLLLMLYELEKQGMALECKFTHYEVRYHSSHSHASKVAHAHTQRIARYHTLPLTFDLSTS